MIVTNAVTGLEMPEEQVGNVVRVYEAMPGGVSQEPVEFTISRLYYARHPNEPVGGGHQPYKRVSADTLCIELQEIARGEGGLRERQPWTKGSEGRGVNTRTMTYQDFLLWKKGDEQALLKAGLLFIIKSA